MAQKDGRPSTLVKTEKTEPTLSGIQIFSLVGFQGSGKSTLGKGLAKHLGIQHVEISEVVRLASGYTTKQELASTAQRTQSNPDWLGELTAHDIKRHIGTTDYSVTISGVREPAVHDFLTRHGATIWGFELYCEASIRYDRLHQLGKVRDGYEFLEQELREIKMGLRQVMRDAQFFVTTSDQTRPKNLILKMAAKLEEGNAI